MIIKGKLNPPELPTQWVERPRLATKLRDLAESHHVVWVCATAGAGKTTAVVEALTDCETPVAWLTLDSAEGAPGRLLSYLEAALARVYPDLDGVASKALVARTPHVETAGLLADAVADRPVVLVIDQLERLTDATAALEVLGAFLRYAPPSTHTVLSSRRELLLEIHSTSAWANVVRVGEADLAFTVEEAGAALAMRESDALDAESAVASTGGWVTGVLFEAWRSDQHVYGAGGEADPLHGYLAAHILADLDDEQRDFLIRSSLLDEVTVRRAEALGLPDVGARLAELQSLHLPATWSEGSKSVRFHPRLREYLIELLGRQPDEEVSELRRRYIEVLIDESRFEEATDLLLDLGDLEVALEVAERALPAVLERLDLAVAERWIGALTPSPGGSSKALAVAELMVAVGQEEYARGMAVSDRLVKLLGDDQPYPAELGAMMVWCYWLAERYDDADRIQEQSEDGPAIRLLSWANDVENIDVGTGYTDEPPPCGGPLDTLALRLHWTHGRLARLLEPHPSPWVEAVQRPWKISALIALGRLDEALVLSDEARDADWSPMFLDCFTRVELLLEMGQGADAWREHINGRSRVEATGSGFFKALHLALEAKLALRLNRDSDQARAALEPVEKILAGRRIQHVVDEHAVWKGLTLLYEDRDEEAAVLLRSTAVRLESRDRLLQLPLIGVYLSETEWRLGNEDAADAAADLALAASTRLGSHHRLLSALKDFPDVVARKIDAEPELISEWHRLGRALLQPASVPAAPPDHPLHLHDFGAPALVGDGRDLRPRIGKSLELVSFLLDRPGNRASRSELLNALFDGRGDESSRSYLRQAVNRLREVLPSADLIRNEDDEVWLQPGEFSSDSQRLLSALAGASELPGEQQLAALLSALEIAARGPFLDGVGSEWAVIRRRELSDIVADAQVLAAETAFAIGDYPQANDLALAALTADPYRESAWQLRMRVFNALGRGDELVATFRGCEQALSMAGLKPSPGTKRLLEQLRR